MTAAQDADGTHWIELEGAANVRDVAGMPTADGRAVQPGQLVRADNLQGLSATDVRHLVDDVGVRDVVDLRTGVEVRSEGPGPMVDEPAVTVRHLSLFPESGELTDAAADDQGTDDRGPVVLPWQDRDDLGDESRQWGRASAIYLRYLDDRPDSIVDALRVVAGSSGATVVHCAAGKDRTGVIVAFALAEVGVTRAAIVADYARTAERITAILDRLQASATYAEDVNRVEATDYVAQHTPRAVTMERFLAAVDERHGGVSRWLRDHGWTESDAAALRAKLLD